VLNPVCVHFRNNWLENFKKILWFKSLGLKRFVLKSCFCATCFLAYKPEIWRKSKPPSGSSTLSWRDRTMWPANLSPWPTSPSWPQSPPSTLLSSTSASTPMSPGGMPMPRRWLPGGTRTGRACWRWRHSSRTVRRLESKWLSDNLLYLCYF